MAHFRNLIESEIAEIETEDADVIRQLLAEGEIGDAYERWQETYKSELDTCKWGEQPLELDVETEAALAHD